jgi:putative transcriptional regulator
MARLTAKELIARDSKRDIKADIAAGMREVRRGRKSTHRVQVFDCADITAARAKVGLSQEKFAAVLGVSRRTLEGWEQGRRMPSGAARSLLIIARKRPDVLREVFAD